MSALHEAFDDPRLRDLGAGAACFVCGHTIRRPAEGCYCAGVGDNNVRLAAHSACISGMDSYRLGVKIQTATFAAVTGFKEKSS